MSTLGRLQKLALWVPCSYCGAKADDWCKTKTGHRATWLHASRQHPIWEANSMGYCEGMRDADTHPESIKSWVRHYENRYGVDR